MLAKREHFQIVALEVRWSKQTNKLHALCNTRQHGGQILFELKTGARILNVIGFSKLSPKLACGIGAVAYALNMTNSSGQHCCSVAHLVPVEL